MQNNAVSLVILKIRSTILLPFIGLVFVIALFSILMASLSPDSLEVFLSLANMRTVAMQTVIVGLGALGMTMVIISGGIDLSAGSVVALSTVTLASVINFGATGSATGGDWTVSPYWVILAIIFALVLSAICGFINGSITARFRIAPFIVTLGMMQIARGCAKWMAGNEMVRTPDNFLKNFMDPVPNPPWLFLAPGVWLLFAMAILVSIMLHTTVLGRTIYALGSSEESARRCGIPIKKMRMIIYSFCGAFGGLAGVMQYSSLGSGSPTEAMGLELDIIAAVVMGGGSLDGGEGSALGTLMGALIMSVLRSGCVMLGVPSYFQEIMIGSIIVAAVGVDRLKHKP